MVAVTLGSAGAASYGLPILPSQTMKQILLLEPRDIRAFVAIAIDFLDSIDGCCDLEDDQPQESNGDDQDYAWPECQYRLV